MNREITFLKSLFPVTCHNRIVLVGGSVRGVLRGSTCKDLDLLASLTTDELCSLGFRLVKARSGADIYFYHHPDFGKIEITRIDSIGDFEDDLRRRDFTVNAIAMTLEGV